MLVLEFPVIIVKVAVFRRAQPKLYVQVGRKRYQKQWTGDDVKNSIHNQPIIIPKRLVCKDRILGLQRVPEPSLE